MIAEVIRKGVILPQVFGNHIRFARCCGVMDSSGKFVSNSGLVRGYHPEIFMPARERIDESVIYLGPLRYDHYGHFLLESTVRLWYLENREKEARIAFSVQPGWDGKLPSFIKDFFRLYGGNILENAFFVQQPTEFSEILIPHTSLSDNEPIYTSQFITPFRRVAERVQAKKYDKIYVSRERFKTGATSLFGEGEIERNFRKNGFHIIYPEKLPLEDQIAYFKGACVVAGVLGTATHSIVFSNPGTELLLLLRSPSCIMMQSVVQHAAGARVSEVKAYEEIIPVPAPHFGPCMLGMTEEMKALFKERRMTDFVGGMCPLKYLSDWLCQFERALLWAKENPSDDDYQLSLCQICYYITLKKKVVATRWRIALLSVVYHLLWGGKWKRIIKRKCRELQWARKASLFISGEQIMKNL